MNLQVGDRIRVTGFNCGHQAYHRFMSMGIRKDSELEIVSFQPSEGPITVKIGNSEVSIGQGMFVKLCYDIIGKDNER